MIFRSRFPDVEIPEVSLAEFVIGHAAEFGDRPALIDGPSGRIVTYAALAGTVRALAAGLAQRGFGKGDVFAVYSPNLPEYAAVLHAVAMLGGITPPANPLHPARHLREHLPDGTTVPNRDRARDRGAALLSHLRIDSLAQHQPASRRHRDHHAALRPRAIPSAAAAARGYPRLPRSPDRARPRQASAGRE